MRKSSRSPGKSPHSRHRSFSAYSASDFERRGSNYDTNQLDKFVHNKTDAAEIDPNNCNYFDRQAFLKYLETNRV